MYSVFSKRALTAGALLVSVLLAACGGSVGSSPAAGSSAASSYKVAFLPIGPITDKSWSESGYNGLIKAKKDFGVTIAYNEQATPIPDAERLARSYAQQGYQLVLLHGGQFVDAASAAQKAYPNVWFCVAGGQVKGDHICSYDPQQQEGSFLAGALAAAMTKTGRLGLVGGFAFPALTRQLEGFKLGARYIKPDVKFQEVYINNWDDPAKGKDAGNALIAAGADVLFAATDAASQGVFAAAAAQGKYAVASYADQNSLEPKAIIASVLYDLSSLVYKTIKLGKDGKLAGEVYPGGLKDGVGDLAINDGLVSASMKSQIATLKADIIAGKIKIPDTNTLGAVGSSDKIDPKTLKQ
jgi:basic membrane protein A